jgi:hypothetical protein
VSTRDSTYIGCRINYLHAGSSAGFDQCRGKYLDAQHIRMYNLVRPQSEMDFPCGAVHIGFIDSTHHQSSEQKGNFFLLMYIMHTSDRQLISKHELNFVPNHWEKWLHFLKYYLSMEEWSRNSHPKNEVCSAGNAIVAVIKSVQLYFPR